MAIKGEGLFGEEKHQRLSISFPLLLLATFCNCILFKKRKKWKPVHMCPMLMFTLALRNRSVRNKERRLLR